MLTRRGFSAITFGHVIVSAREPTPAIWRHELRHLAQYERIGLAFLPLYLWLHFRRGYARHPLERKQCGQIWKECETPQQKRILRMRRIIVRRDY